MGTRLHHVKEQRIDDFRPPGRCATRRALLNNVDHYLDQIDQAKAQGDNSALEWAKACWICIWDELDARDGVRVAAS